MKHSLRAMRITLLAGSFLAAGSAYAAPVQAYQGPGNGRQNASEATSELLLMVEQLRDEVRNLRGMVEEQGHRLEQLNRQARDRYVDLDQRLLDMNQRMQVMEKSPATSSLAVPAVSGSAVPAASGSAAAPVAGAATADAAKPKSAREYRAPGKEEEAAYQAIRTLITSKSYDKAVDELYQFVARYPEGDLTVNAYYWLGEAYLAKPQLEQARQAFTIVATRFSDHRKAADASFKLAVVQDRMGQKGEAKKLLQAVLAQYPNTPAASLAQAYLAGLGK